MPNARKSFDAPRPALVGQPKGPLAPIGILACASAQPMALPLQPENHGKRAKAFEAPIGALAILSSRAG
mgnify:FL=1